MSPQKIICFFGPDGSGKTTLARELAQLFAHKGIKTKISWMRGTHTFASVLARFLNKFKYFKGHDNPYYGIKIPSNFVFLWQFIEVISIIPIWFFRYVFPRLLGYVVIGERSLVDFIVWMILTTHDYKFITSFLGKIILSLNNKLCQNIYITANKDILIQRRKDITIYTIPMQLLLYDVIARNIKVPIIDTSNKDISSCMKELISIIF
ncbi:hypothetical protein J4526_03815 [Desulfurococcaceae archaeon MEX13E-LK6-19]|nr:hypothetical protein J4526_03815 [Desulfurococcaceae archaeon MEX13E-LK6-19]